MRRKLTSKPRRRIQRAFVDWLSESRDRFSIPVMMRRTDHVIDFSFEGIHPAIQGALVNWEELNVAVDWQDVCWDLIISLDVSPEKTEGGYICTMCDPDKRTVFPSKEALWRDHLFEPLLKWVNDDLANAHWLGIYGTEGATWVKLRHDKIQPDGESECLIELLPLRGGKTGINQITR